MFNQGADATVAICGQLARTYPTPIVARIGPARPAQFRNFGRTDRRRFVYSTVARLWRASPKYEFEVRHCWSRHLGIL